MQAANQARHDQETASWEAAVSTWIDGEGEIRPEELDTPYGRQLWDTYHLIGDVLRNQDLAIKPSDFLYARISKAIDAEPHIVAPRGLRRHGVMRIGLSGLAMAAAVASVVWVAMPYLTGQAPAEATQGGAMLASANEDGGLKDYLDAHREIAGVSPIRQVSLEASR